MLAEMMPHEYPVVLGRDAAGVVEAVGAGVDHVAVGDEVIGHVLLAPPIQAGTLAEYALLPAAAVAAKPAGLDFVTAAALPLAGAAAVAAVDAIDPRPGQTVLVNGASGGVGSYAIQLLAARGVTVVATGTAEDADRLTGLGAATVIDYTAGPVAEQVRAAYPDGVDALIDLAAYTPDAPPLDAVRKGGRVAASTGAADEQTLAAAGLTGTTSWPARSARSSPRWPSRPPTAPSRSRSPPCCPSSGPPKAWPPSPSGQARGKIVVKIATDHHDHRHRRHRELGRLTSRKCCGHPTEQMVALVRTPPRPPTSRPAG